MSARPDPIREWREEYERLGLAVDFAPQADVRFHALAHPIFVSDGLRAVRARYSAGFVFRDKHAVKDGKDGFGLMISQSCNLEVAHRGSAFQLGQGDAALFDVRSTATCGSRQSFGYVSVLVSRRELDGRIARPEDTVIRYLPRRDETVRLLRRYLCSLERIGLAHAAGCREMIRRHIIDLFAIAIAPRGDLGESSTSAIVAARLAAALDHIAAHFDDPELSLQSVARSQGISVRYLQRLMESAEMSFAAHLNEMRLKRAFALLVGPYAAARRISDIALAVGFSDISHFNRMFHARFGYSPSRVRMQALRA